MGNTASCKPCGWFWKPQGCQNGAACNHCHLCPADEFHRRRKAKASCARLSANSYVKQVVSDGLEPTGREHADIHIDDLASTKQVLLAEDCNEIPAVPNSKPMTSEGSRLHGLGECRPCSWFWKPRGCQFGAECLHCHSCPEDEQKRRKKDKVVALRAAGVPKN